MWEARLTLLRKRKKETAHSLFRRNHRRHPRRCIQYRRRRSDRGLGQEWIQWA
jgi:hypothetical protein